MLCENGAALLGSAGKGQSVPLGQHPFLYPSSQGRCMEAWWGDPAVTRGLLAAPQRSRLLESRGPPRIHSKEFTARAPRSARCPKVWKPLAITSSPHLDLVAGSSVALRLCVTPGVTRRQPDVHN